MSGSHARVADDAFPETLNVGCILHQGDIRSVSVRLVINMGDNGVLAGRTQLVHSWCKLQRARVWRLRLVDRQAPIIVSVGPLRDQSMPPF